MMNFDPTNPWGYLDEVPQKSDQEPPTDEEQERAAHVRMIYACVVNIAVIIAGVLIGWLLSGCQSQRVVTVERVKTDTVRQTLVQRDSIYYADSIYISDFVRDDTVWSVRERWHTRYIERSRTDTVYESRRDSIPLPYEVVREVPAELTWWQRVRLSLGNIAVYTLLIGTALWLIRRRM